MRLSGEESPPAGPAPMPGLPPTTSCSVTSQGRAWTVWQASWAALRPLVQPETPPSAPPGPAIAAAPPATTGAMTASLAFNRD